jgi:hypothetical protein
MRKRIFVDVTEEHQLKLQVLLGKNRPSTNEYQKLLLSLIDKAYDIRR